MKATLLFPPQWTAAQPYFGLATLNGQLRAAGHQVQIRDLNLEFMDWALSAEGVMLSLQRLRSDRVFAGNALVVERALNPGSKRLEMLEARVVATEAYLQRWEGADRGLASLVEEAKSTLRDRGGFYDPEVLVEALGVVDGALHLVSLPYFPAEIRWNDFHTPLVSFNLQPITAFCKDALANPFRRFFERWLPEVLDDESQLYALSIASFSQVIPGLTLAMMLRERLRGRAMLCVGGNFFSRLEEKLKDRPEFFRSFADVLVIGEGERSTLELAESVEGKRPLGRVSNLMYLDEAAGRVVSTGASPNLRMADMAVQSLDGFPLERYLSPDRVVCLRASKGCYYGQCTFCDSYHGLERDQIGVERLVAEIRQLRDTYGIRHFEFVDQCIAPRYMEEMCRAFVAADLGVSWFCNGRTDREFTPELFESMRRAGNTMVLWGIESGSPRLLKLMKKGVSPTDRLALLRGAERAGLFNFAYVFFGFPTESEAEAMSTIDLIRSNVDLIHAYGRSVFTLGRHSPLMADAERLGIIDTVEDDQDLSTNLSFRLREGLYGPAVDAWARRCNELCRAAYGDPLWMALRSRENLHLYLAHHGRDYVRGFDLSTVRTAGESDFVF